VIASRCAHRDSVSRCLSNGLCKGDDGLVKFSCVLDGWVLFEGEVQGGSEEGPVKCIYNLRQTRVCCVLFSGAVSCSV
jgi:hypothetical protein